jgi:hypothetical protein
LHSNRSNQRANPGDERHNASENKKENADANRLTLCGSDVDATDATFILLRRAWLYYRENSWDEYGKADEHDASSGQAKL